MTQELVDSHALSAIARAEIDVQVSTAHAFPRNISAFMNQATAMVTRSEKIAASCIFSLPRKDKGKQIFIKGRSIRLAEIVFSCYGNIYVQSRFLNMGKTTVSINGKTIEKDTVTVEGVAWDLEKNSKCSETVTDNVNGSFGDAVKLVIGSATSKVIRNVIFRVVPRVFVDELYEIAGKYVIGDQSKLQTKLKELLGKFQLMGIEQEKIFAFIGKSTVEELDKDDFLSLVGVGTAIKDGELNIDSAFVIDDTNSDLPGKERVSHLLAMKQGAANGVDPIENQG